VRSALTHADGVYTTAPDWNFLNKKIRDTVSQYLYAETKRRPMILPVVVEL
jgi:ribonuclease J